MGWESKGFLVPFGTLLCWGMVPPKKWAAAVGGRRSDPRDAGLRGKCIVGGTQFSWESKGTPPMPPPQEIRPLIGVALGGMPGFP